MYTLAGLANNETGWGVRDETWSAAQMLDLYGEETWFKLGDRDLATHVARTARLRNGASLTTVTRELAAALGVGATLLPMSDDVVRTKVRTADGWLEFQDYFVRRGHRDDVQEVRFDGMDSARPTPDVLDAIGQADLVLIAPSNPFVSVAPILALPGVLDALNATNAPVAAISPIVGGEALRGPAAQMMRSLGATPSATGVAAHYADRYPGLVDVLFIDDADSTEAGAIADLGVEPAIAGIVIADEPERARLAREILAKCGLAALPGAAGP
jgi:LPPG:FO 2-phospho-L-lactate transferase